MKFFFILLVIFVSFQILVQKPQKRLLWFLLGISLLSNHIMVTSSINSHMFISYVSIIAIFKDKLPIRCFQNFPLKGPLLILFITHLFVGFFDERLSIPLGLYRGFYTYMYSFFLIFIGYFLTFNTNLKITFRYLIIISLIVSIYAIIVAIIKNNPYYDIVESSFSWSSIWSSSMGDRGFRVSSTVSNPIFFGLFISILTMFVYVSNMQLLKKCIIIFLLLASLYLTKSRTPIVSFIIMILSYILLYYPFKMKILHISLGIVLLILIMSILPTFNIIFSSIIEMIFKGDSDLQGSTIDLRNTQFNAALLYFSQNPIWGNGYFYFSENLFAGKIANYEGQLAGMEGYLYELFIEQGLVQIFAVVYFFVSIYSYLVKRFAVDKKLVSLSLSILTGYIFFILATGANETWIYVMPFVGVMLNKIQYKNKYGTSINKAYKKRITPLV